MSHCFWKGFINLKLPFGYTQYHILIVTKQYGNPSKVLDDLQLRDLPLSGGSYTWNGGLNNQSFSRLDRFLVLENWESYSNGLLQSVLSKPVSDHTPILLNGKGGQSGPIPFRFENMWQ